MIDEAWLDDLKRRVDLVELGRRYGVQWDTRGKEPRACCPFHPEKTASFYALRDPRRGVPRFVCYGSCGRSWSAVSFLVDGHRREFREAVEELAGLAGLEVPKGRETQEARDRREAAKARRASILDAIELAQRYFVSCLGADRPEAEEARAYLERRGLQAAVEPWGIGFAPGGQGLVQWLDRHQVPADVAEAAYLTGRRDDGSRYPFFWDGRVTLPWRDHQGRLVAHVGRTLGDGEPKYLNPGEIPGLFVKGELVFGLDRAARAVADEGEAWVVEGQVSAITPHLHGLRHVVACGGKAFSPAHARALRAAGARRLVFLLDGDDAGRAGAAAASRVALGEGLPALVAELPQGLDPDDFLRAEAA